MPESENASAQARVREDTKNIKDLFDQLDIEVAPVTVYRMGKTGDKPRLLKVELPTRQHTRRILQTKKHLANHQKFASVRIRASMTPEERAHRADLIKKCNEMRASDPTADLVIWRGEIVSRALIRDKLEEEKANAGTKL